MCPSLASVGECQCLDVDALSALHQRLVTHLHDLLHVPDHFTTQGVSTRDLDLVYMHINYSDYRKYTRININHKYTLSYSYDVPCRSS